MLDSGHCNKI